MRFSSLDSVMERAKSLGTARVAVAAADDKEVLEAIKLAQEEGLVSPVLVGDAKAIKKLAAEIGLKLDRVELIDQADPAAAAHAAVDAVVDGRADFLMKGMVNSAQFLKAVLRSEHGLRSGRLLSHLGAFEVPSVSRLLFVTDGGMNVAPDFAQKKEILQSAIDYLQIMGMETVNVVALAANEIPNPKMPATMDAQALQELNRAGEFPGAVVEGPLALDGAVSEIALRHKGIKSRINGNTDLFLVPSIEVGNVLGKSLVYFAQATMAGIVLGAQVPIVLTSRNDSPRSKLMSLAMASLSRQTGSQLAGTKLAGK